MTDAPTESLLLPEGTRLLHIGPPKTGSTALQAAMHSQREQMRRHGVVHVASDQRGRETVLAALMNDDFSKESDPRLLQRWQTLLDEVENAGDQRVCISNESMARVDLTKARTMLNALGGERSHVVAVVRRLDRLLPSQWQEWVRLGSTSLTYEQWLEIVLGDHPEDPNWQAFWLPHDLQALVDRWMGLTAPERFTLIVADETDPLLLSRAFEQLLGLPGGLLRPEESHRKNVSASLARVETVRRLNEVLEARDWPADVKATLRSRVAKRIRSAPAWPGETPIPGLPGWAAERVNELNEQRAQLVKALGVQVIGEPANLAAPMSGEGVGKPVSDLVSTELAVQSIVTAIGGAVELLAQERSRPRRPKGQAGRKGRQGGPKPAAQSIEDYGARDLSRELRRRLARRLPGRS